MLYALNRIETEVGILKPFPKNINITDCFQHCIIYMKHTWISSVLWCSYGFLIKTMFGSSLLPDVCRSVYLLRNVYLLYLRCLLLFAYSGVQHILCRVFVLFFFVLYTLCCQFRWIVLFWLPLRYSLTFIYFCLASILIDGRVFFSVS